MLNLFEILKELLRSLIVIFELYPNPYNKLWCAARLFNQTYFHEDVVLIE